MEPHTTFEAQRAWKLAYSPYLSQTNGSLIPVCAVPDQPAATPVCGRVVALPMVISLLDSQRRLYTRATAVLIQAEAGSNPKHAPRLAVQPLPLNSPCAAIRSITPLKGHFSA